MVFDVVVGTFTILSGVFTFIPLVGKPKLPEDLLDLLQTELTTTLNDLQEHRDVIQEKEYRVFLGKLDNYHEKYTSIQIMWRNTDIIDSILACRKMRKNVEKMLKGSIRLHKDITDASNAAKIAKLKLELTPCTSPPQSSPPLCEGDLEYPPTSVSSPRANRDPFRDADSNIVASDV